MNTFKISGFMLERYRLGELDGEDKNKVENALAMDADLRSRLESLDESDRELRLQYPVERFSFEISGAGIKIRRFPGRGTGKSRLRLTGIAAVFMVFILLPVLYFARNIRGTGAADTDMVPGSPTDRAKGSAHSGFELSLFLKDDMERPISGSELLSEGNTVQLAYAAPAGHEFYGVIFSIDGRSELTLHYPYRMGQNPVLVSGRRTYLNEAYTLDDAPCYEIFFLVASSEPINVEDVLAEARKMAVKTAGSIQTADYLEKESKAAFSGYDVETLTLLKNERL